jgi:hypothetical protein
MHMGVVIAVWVVIGVVSIVWAWLARNDWGE